MRFAFELWPLRRKISHTFVLPTSTSYNHTIILCVILTNACTICRYTSNELLMVTLTKLRRLGRCMLKKRKDDAEIIEKYTKGKPLTPEQ